MTFADVIISVDKADVFGILSLLMELDHPDLEVPLEKPLDLRVKSFVGGCYAVFLLGECLYVGGSNNLRARINAHWRRGGGWILGGVTDGYIDMPVAPEGCVLKVWFSNNEIWTTERRLIEKYLPKHNTCPVAMLAKVQPEYSI